MTRPIPAIQDYTGLTNQYKDQRITAKIPIIQAKRELKNKELKEYGRQGYINSIEEYRYLESLALIQFHHPLKFAQDIMDGVTIAINLLKTWTIQALKSSTTRPDLQALQYRLYDKSAGEGHCALDNKLIEEEVYSSVLLSILENPSRYSLTGYKQVLSIQVLKPINLDKEVCKKIPGRGIYKHCSKWIKKVIREAYQTGMITQVSFDSCATWMVSKNQFYPSSLIELNETDYKVIKFLSQAGYIRLHEYYTETRATIFLDGAFISPLRTSVKFNAQKFLSPCAYGKQRTDGEERIPLISIDQFKHDGGQTIAETIPADGEESIIELDSCLQNTCRRIAKKYKLSIRKEVDLYNALRYNSQDGVSNSKIAKALYGEECQGGARYQRAQDIYKSVLVVLEEELKQGDTIQDQYTIQSIQESRISRILEEAV